MSIQKPLLISINGPTAVGKTAQAIAVAKHFNTVILSSDSRQFYREMSIGTAKPSSEELAEVKHYFIDSLSIHDEYSAGQFEREALTLLEELFQRFPVVVLVGGSGLYTEAVVKGFDKLPKDPEVRAELNAIFEKEGIEILQTELKAKDPEQYEKMDIQNQQRVIRALEVCRISGEKYSNLIVGKASKRDFDTLSFSLNMERPKLYERINQRVDQMMDTGLIDEVRTLHPHKNLAALNTVGYKELFRHLDGELELDEAIALMKQNTRRFAKRQVTWLGRIEANTMIEAGNNELLIQAIEKEMSKRQLQ